MKIELKPFQEQAAQEIREHIESAWSDIRRGHAQAIVLSSPTGSGKTATITAVMERLYQGYDAYPADVGAIFLWLSDSPELNQQSRDKIASQSSVFDEHDLVMIEPPFSQECLQAGKIYFLNIQKLGKDSLLTKPGDEREFTIWQTIQNTAQSAKEHFYVIIDEAHRGMNEKPREIEQAATIIQRFIKGYAEGGMQPLSLVIGMSATPDRFDKLVRGTGRIVRPVEISADAVKTSGLLKDEIVLFYPDDDQPADWSLLEQSVLQWKRFTKEWEDYCKSQKLDTSVKPVLVIQVESGTKTQLTHTDLGQVVRVVERAVGRLPDGSWAHAFQEDADIEAGGQRIRKLDASKIESDPLAQVVLFKMSLSTGWDCPRAEVLMSFRRAQDYTYIAQLVGRMVRTPLARSIETNDFLNTVSVYLPHYDYDGLQAILNKLNNPDPETGIGVRAESGKNITYVQKDPSKADQFDKLATLKTYRVERLEKSAPVPRLMKLARQLAVHDEVNADIYPEVKALIVSTLTDELRRLSKSPEFIGNVTANQEIVIREIWVEYGEWQEVGSPKMERVPATPENVDDLFRQCDRLLGNEGLHMEYWRSRHDTTNPMKAKLQLYGILRDGKAWARLSDVCQAKIDELFKKHNRTIRRLATSRQEVYNRIRRSAKAPQPEPLFISPNAAVPKASRRWEQHLYIEPNGSFCADLNSWEEAVLQAERSKPGFTGWLRNPPRKDWSLCIPYQADRVWKALYPDILVFRKHKGTTLVDILDPHDSNLPDSVVKAKGLVEYAIRHGEDFDRIELIIQDATGRLRRLDMKNPAVQSRIQGLRDTAPGDLTKLFDELA